MLNKALTKVIAPQFGPQTVSPQKGNCLSLFVITMHLQDSRSHLAFSRAADILLGRAVRWPRTPTHQPQGERFNVDQTP